MQEPGFSVLRRDYGLKFEVPTHPLPAPYPFQLFRLKMLRLHPEPNSGFEPYI